MVFLNFLNNIIYKHRVRKQWAELGVLDKSSPFWKPFLLLLPSILVIFLFTFLPFIYSLSKSVTVANNPNKASDVSFGFANFTDIWNDPNFVVAIRNSVIYSVVALPITLMISLIVASTLASLHRKYARGFWQTVFFLPYVTSGIAVSIAFAFIFDSSRSGFINSITGSETRWLESADRNSFKALFVILTSGVWRNLAFEILILTTAMVSVNPTLYKAASIDGASPLKQFFKITLPSVSRTINFLITIGIIAGIKVFPIGIFRNPGDAFANGGNTLLLYIYSFVQSSQFGLAGAATLFLFIFGVALSVTVKQGLNLVVQIANKIGERNVYRKIKTSTIH